MNTEALYERYHRQIILKDFGETGQQKLLAAKVLVVGAGGLGCPALQYLTAAGVGTIGIVDHDVVSLSNLHRQTLYSVDDIGKFKAERAATQLRRLNPDINIECHNERLTARNAAGIIGLYDYILDGSDNFPTRYLVNDVCVLLDRVLVYGAINQYEGQVAVFNCKAFAGEAPVNYRDLFPESPAQDEVPNCEEAGVLGVVPGIIGSMMANETIKLITGIGEPLINRLLAFDVRNNRLHEFELTTRSGTRAMIPEDLNALQNSDYDWSCAPLSKFEIGVDQLDKMLQTEDVTVIDVRENLEQPRIDQFEHIEIPLSQLQDAAGELKTNTIVLFCQSGKRSRQGAQLLDKIFSGSKTIYSLRGGITAWLNRQKEIV